MEPPVCASVRPAHPLARGLGGCWLLNEGAGGTARDVSGHHHHGAFSGDLVWSQGRFGRAVEFDGADDWITMGDCLDLGTDDVTMLALVRYSAATQPDSWSGSHYGAIAGKGYLGPHKGYGLLVDPENKISWQVRNLASYVAVASNTALNDGLWHLAIGVCDRDDPAGVRLYIDGVQQGAATDATAFDGIDLGGSRAFAIGSRQDDTSGVWLWDFLGSIGMVCVWNRVLTEAEVRRLHLNPFEMFAPRRSLAVLAPSAGGIVPCAGSIGAVGSVGAAIRVARNVAGATAAVTSLCGSLQETGVTRLSGTVHGGSTLHADLRVTSPEAAGVAPQNETDWRREALFSGATHTAFMLGTVLTQGWFWARRNGCTTVHRGVDLTTVDLGRVLYVAEADVREISLPVWLSHPPGSTYCYLVRRFNGCGRQERTVAAATVLRIASDGRKASPRPNAVQGLRSERVGAAGARLVWFYCPLDQEIAPAQFNLYGSDATHEADSANPMAVVRYDGRRFYAWLGLVPAGSANTFIVRAASAEGTEGAPSACAVPQVAAMPPGPPLILTAAAF